MRALVHHPEIVVLEQLVDEEPAGGHDDVEVALALADDLVADREELRLRGQVETERSTVKFDVVDPPSTPLAPSAPNRPLLLLAVLVVGLGAGGGTAFALGKFNGTFATAGKLEQVFELPVIGTISHTLTDAARALARRKRKQFAMASGGLGGLFVILLAVEFIQRGMVA